MTEKKNEELKRNEQKVEESNVMDEKVEKVEEQKTKLFVERESFTGSDGRTYWNYVLRAKILNKEKNIHFSPKDKGGYSVLELLFELSDKAELVMTTSTMKDDAGKRTRYTSYKLVTYDEEEIPYEATVKPTAESDKNLLVMVLRTLEKKGVW